MARAKKPETTTFDQLLAAAAVVIVVIQFFIERTRVSAALSGLLIFLVAVRPLTRLPGVINSRLKQWLVGCGLFFLVFVWLVSIWPEKLPPKSDLRVENLVFQPFKAGVPPHADLSVFSDSPSAIHAHYTTLTVVF
jgi:hypothetical protein